MSLLVLLHGGGVAAFGDPLTVEWRVLIRNASGDIVDELDNWISLTVEPMFNGVGPFEMEISSDGVSARIINETCGIILTRNDAVVYSGQIMKFTRSVSTITCSGVSDEWLLLRPALPDPLGPPFTTAYNVVTGQAGAVLRLLAFNNLALPYCRPDRVVSNLLIEPDPVLGGTITGRADGGPLLPLLARLAATPAAGGLGFKIRQTSATASTRTLSIYAPADKSGEVQFSVDYGTAIEYHDTQEAPPSTFWYVMGDDNQGLDKRTIFYGGNATQIANWGLIEKFYDAHGVTDPAELAALLQSLIYGSAPSHTVHVTPFETPSLQFVDHWNVGDVVSFVGPDGVPFPEVIRSARIELTPDRGIIVTPMIGNTGSSDASLTAQHLSSLQARVGGLEQDWRVPDSSIIRSMLTGVLQPPIGQVLWLAGSGIPTGYLAANGQAVSRTAYAALFAVLGTTWGVGNGTTTFNLPDLRDRLPRGVGAFALGATGGAPTVDLVHTHTPTAHTHPGSHSHGPGSIQSGHVHTGAPHTHPGSHSHGHAHTHPLAHTHTTDIDHDHAVQTSGGVQYVTDSLGRDAAVATGTGHNHQVNLPALGASTITSSAASTADTSNSSTSTTATDSSAPAASSASTGAQLTSGTSTGTTASDASAPAAAYLGALTGPSLGPTSILNPFATLSPVIYTGV